MTPLISVVIPTYNRREKLLRCLASVYANDTGKAEVIVVDDGSTDGTEGALRKHFPDVLYLFQKNSGVSVARNRGMKKASGDYIAFLDSDDVWYPQRLSFLASLLPALPEDVGIFFHEMDILRDGCGDGVASLTHYFGRSPKMLIGAMQQRVVCNHDGDEHVVCFGRIYEELVKDNLLSPSCVVIRRSVFAHLGGFRQEFKVAEDAEYFLRIARSYGVAYSHKVLTSVEQPTSEISLSNYVNNTEKVRTMALVIEEHLASCNDKPLKEILARRSGELDMTLGYHYLSDYDTHRARICFRRALNKPSGRALLCYGYLLLSCLPIWVLQVMATIKRKSRVLHG